MTVQTSSSALAATSRRSRYNMIFHSNSRITSMIVLFALLISNCRVKAFGVQILMRSVPPRVPRTMSTEWGLPRSRVVEPSRWWTQLGYRNAYRSLQEDGTAMSSSTGSGNSRNWWKVINRQAPSITPARADDEDEKRQAVVDDYLEFLDRRYNRLYANNPSDTIDLKFLSSVFEPQKNSQAAAAESPLDGPGGQGPVNDALYILGVAGMASQKLLKKKPHRRNHMRQTKDSSASSVKSDTPPSSTKNYEVAISNNEAQTTTMPSILAIGTYLAIRTVVPVLRFLEQLRRINWLKPVSAFVLMSFLLPSPLGRGVVSLKAFVAQSGIGKQTLSFLQSRMPHLVSMSESSSPQLSSVVTES